MIPRRKALPRTHTSVLPSLCPRFQVLVDIGFRLATGGVEALKPWGVALLQQVVVTFGKLEDPLLPGERQGHHRLLSCTRDAY